jgi:uncharacterized protein (UPF0335 family)
MFGNQKQELEKLRSNNSDLAERLGDTLNKLADAENKMREHEAEVLKLKEEKIELQRDITEEKHNHSMLMSQLESDHKIQKNEIAVDLKDKVSSLESDKKILENKVEVYEKAFKNLGFDVKDMKAILDKLVDGLIKKNEINIVK